jgi:hypothetical protein
VAIFNVRYECRQIREVYVFAKSEEEARAKFAEGECEWDSLVSEDDGSEPLVVTDVWLLANTED